MGLNRYGIDGLPIEDNLPAALPVYSFLPDPGRTAYQAGWPSPTPDYQGRASRVTTGSQIVAESIFDDFVRVTAPQYVGLSEERLPVVQLVREPDTDAYDGTLFPTRGV